MCGIGEGGIVHREGGAHEFGARLVVQRESWSGGFGCEWGVVSPQLWGWYVSYRCCKDGMWVVLCEK